MDGDLVYLQSDQWERVRETLLRYRVRCMTTERERIDELIEGIEAQTLIEFELED